MKGALAKAGWIEIRRRLGEGTFGVVFEAFDRRRNTRVAVKVPQTLDAATVYYFKREFRALADVRHRNLVTLHDLVSDGDEWLFSMEFIDGEHLLDGLRDANAVAAGPAGPSSFDRLRDVFGQLAEGISALHGAGILHRDLKPSNVLVERGGRVVVVDFGLVKELTPLAAETAGRIIGSPRYMAPEQLAGETVSAASDWYSFGVMLYEALVGDPPFQGTLLALYEAKRDDQVAAPHEIVSGLPMDLSMLCRRLLRSDPAARPGAAEIVALLAARPQETFVTIPATFEHRTPLVGRDQHLRVLTDAFDAVQRNRSVTVHICGRSGMGKTALARGFIEGLRARESSTVVLTGRCYERESVPYKALDSLIDELSRYLNHLKPTDAARMLPRDVHVLARLFPVLGGVAAVAAAPQRVVEVPNAQELRRRAAAALRELLARVADERPLVLLIDDLQWGDIDSGVVLGDLLRPPDPPSLLLLLCYRSEDIEGNPLLRMLRTSPDRWVAGGESVELEVGELSREEAGVLARTLLAGRGAEVEARGDALAADSGGSPFFLGELVRYGALGSAPAETVPSLDEVIRARAAQLSEDARRLLDVVAVAGGPVQLRVAHAAAGLGVEEAPAVGLLRTERLIRTRRTDERDEIETYHDRIREAVIGRLGESSLRALNAGLARAWETVGGADPETLATHWQRAGAPERAARYAVEAASQASQALAFDRAARLYRLSLSLQRPADSSEEGRLQIRLGDALANAGRGAAAAEAYLAGVVDGTPPGERLELRRRAAQQLLISGHIDEGLQLLREVLGALHMRLARTPRRALVFLVIRALHLRLRGLRFQTRDAATLTDDETRLLDTCWVAVTGLGMSDSIRAFHFQLVHLLIALRIGEPYRVVRALALQAGQSVMRGRRSGQRADRLLRQATKLADELGHPHARGLCLTIRAAVASFHGHFRAAIDLAQMGEEVLRSECTGVSWELDTALIFHLHSLYWTGQWRTLAHRLPALLREAEDRGDLYLSTYIGTRSFYVCLLAADATDEAMQRQSRTIEAWSRQGFQVQHYWDWIARVEIDLYAGRGEGAWRRLEEGWRLFVSSRLDANQAIFIESRFLRARAALAAAAERGAAASAPLVRRAERDATSIERQRARWGAALAGLVRAAVAATRGLRNAAIDLTTSAEDEFRALEMAQFAAAARYRRGQLLGIEQGRRLVEEAEAWMRAEGIANPAHMTGMLAPGI